MITWKIILDLSLIFVSDVRIFLLLSCYLISLKCICWIYIYIHFIMFLPFLLSMSFIMSIRYSPTFLWFCFKILWFVVYFLGYFLEFLFSFDFWEDRLSFLWLKMLIKQKYFTSIFTSLVFTWCHLKSLDLSQSIHLCVSLNLMLEHFLQIRYIIFQRLKLLIS